jgi:hypothetical protein
MSTATFLVHPERPDARALALDTADWLTGRGDVARILEFTAPNRVTEAGRELHLDEVDLAGTTVAVSLGGTARSCGWCAWPGPRTCRCSG